MRYSHHGAEDRNLRFREGQLSELKHLPVHLLIPFSELVTTVISVALYEGHDLGNIAIADAAEHVPCEA